MRIINVISEGGSDVGTKIKYKYKRVKYNEKDETYLYEFKYLNSGLKLVLILNSSEVFQLMSGDKYFDKFEKALERAFAIYIRNIQSFFKKGKENT